MIGKSLLILSIFVLLIGCAGHKSGSIFTKGMLDVLISPQIDNGSVCYYFECWGPGSTVLKVHYDGDKILSVESKWIEDLNPYIPMLIESIKDREKNEGATAHRAHQFLVCALRMTYPNGYYYIMHPTIDGYEGTPFKSYDLTKTTYDEWKKWYEKEGKKGVH